MTYILSGFSRFFPLTVWAVACALGGIWLVRGLFRLKKSEEILVGLTVGLITTTWLVNLLGRILEFDLACWLSVLMLLIVGFFTNFPNSISKLKEKFTLQINFWIWIPFFILVALFWRIGNGMAIMDEFQTLPLISQLAAGDIPLHFPLDPAVIYNYHYFPYLISAQFMRIGNMYPWTALDLQHALILTLSLFLLGIWVKRVTRSNMAGIVAAVFYFFSGGTRWIMLLLPQNVVALIDESIQRMGSGLNSGPTLQTALVNPWAAQGTGPFTIPFAFANGLNSATSIGLGYTNFVLLFLILILITFKRWNNWKAVFIYIVIMASMALTHETSFVFLILATLALVGYSVIRNKQWKISKDLIFLGVALLVAGLITLFQGGVLTGIFQGFLLRSDANLALATSYHDLKILLNFPPSIVDAHLGILSFTNPIHLLVILLEIGPMILLIYFIIVWGIKAERSSRTFESILSWMALLSIILIFFTIDLKSTTIGALTRAQNFFLLISRIFAVPIILILLPEKKEIVKIIYYGLIAVTLLGGLVIFGLEMIAIQKPIQSTFLEPLDAKIMDYYWSQLDENYLVFDPIPYRSAVLFGKPTNAGLTWFDTKPAYDTMFNNPDPQSMQENGFGYVYSDRAYLKSLPNDVSKRFEQTCVKVLADYKDDFGSERILMDIRACQ